MKALKKEDGFTLVEIILVFGIFSILLLLLSTNYLAVNKSYLKEAKKANNLEEARLVVNFITDNFQTYEAGHCTVMIKETNSNIENNEEGTVKEITFKERDGSQIQTIKYEDHKVTFQSQEISSHIHNFRVKRRGDLYDFVIEVKQAGNGAMPDQTLTVGTTVHVKYRSK